MKNIDYKTIQKFLKNKSPKENDIKEIKEILEYCSDIYYNTEDQSPLTDGEFDELLKHYSNFVKFKSGAKPKIGKKIVNVKHVFDDLVGTLDKCNNIKDVEEWFSKIKLPKKFSILISEKYDGNSMCAEVDKKRYKLALTRGEDGEGADLLPIFRDRRIKVDIDDNLGIKYEVITTQDDFEKICELKGKDYANARSVVAGILSDLEGFRYGNYLTLVPLRVKLKNKDITRLEEVKIIERMNKDLKVPFVYRINEGTLEQNVKFIEEVYQDYIKNKRHTINYMIDGLVIEIMDDELRKKLGRSDDRGNYEFALKFRYMVKRTKVKDIEFYCGKTGV